MPYIKDDLSKPIFVHISPYWFWRTSLIPTQHQVCQARNEQVVINWIEFDTADVVRVSKRTELTAWQANRTKNITQ